MTLAELLEAATPGPWYWNGELMLDTHAKAPWILRMPDDWRTDTADDADANLIALAPDLARLALDMGEALRHPSIPPGFYREHSRELLARLDGIANKDKTT